MCFFSQPLEACLMAKDGWKVFALCLVEDLDFNNFKKIKIYDICLVFIYNYFFFSF